MNHDGVADYTWPLPNVWLGVSVEDQATADERVPKLLHLPAAVRWVSYEPALGPVDFAPFVHLALADDDPRCGWDRRTGEPVALDWIVVGGESGPGARPFDVAWARSTIAQCEAAAVPVFVKQLGSAPYVSGMYGPRDPVKRLDAPGGVLRGWVMDLVNRKGGDPDEWPEDLRRQEFPEVSR